MNSPIDRYDYPATLDEDILLMQDGDRTAEGRVFGAIARIATQQGLRFNQSRCDIEEIVGQTVLRVYERGILGGGYRFKPPGLDAYTMTVAHRIIIDRLKSSDHKKSVLADPQDYNHVIMHVPAKDEIAIFLDRYLIEGIIRDTQVSEENLYCFLRKHRDGVTMEEIIIEVKEKFELDITVGSLKQRLFRTKQALREVAEALQEPGERLLFNS